MIRSDKPIPLSLESIYYFEVKILSKGKETAIGIGLTVEATQLNRMPDWDRNTIGYHDEMMGSFSMKLYMGIVLAQSSKTTMWLGVD